MSNVQNLKKTFITEPLLKRFLSYVKIWTTSDSSAADKGIQPSTERQRDFAQFLQNELCCMGVTDVTLTKESYLCARIPASKGYENAPSVCFLAHLDTVEEVSGKDVNPQVIADYDGNAITLKNNIVLDPDEDPALAQSTGDTIITSDGTTLLGADDKAGLAAIMMSVEYILANKVPHGQIEVIFSPDEETGHGMDNVPTDWIQSKFCYTVDGGDAGEVEAECFNACKADIKFEGRATHTGTARPGMVNAVTMAAKFLQMLPQQESPETTDGYQGFYAPMEVAGHIESAAVILFLRDFDADGMNRRIETVKTLAKATEAVFPGGKVSVKITEQYKNMKDGIMKNPAVVEKLSVAVKNAGLPVHFVPIRGGTDGSRLTEMGLPTPNIFTGGHNFHSKKEWASLSQMTSAVEVICELVKLWSAEK